VPLVDDDAIDAVVKRTDGSFITVQIKARSMDVIEGDAALFAAIPHELRENYWFIFYSERMDTTWIMTSKEFITEAVQNKTGKNKGKRSIWFNGTKRDKAKGRDWILQGTVREIRRHRFSETKEMTGIQRLLFQVNLFNYLHSRKRGDHDNPDTTSLGKSHSFAACGAGWTGGANSTVSECLGSSFKTYSPLTNQQIPVWPDLSNQAQHNPDCSRSEPP